METKELKLEYSAYAGVDELDAEDAALAGRAVDAMKNAYAPYSDFTVGAAVRLDDGTVVIGANQENLAYPSGLCAERTAIFAAGAQYPGRRITSIAIAGGAGGVLSDSPVTPCGACRQVMSEMGRKSPSAVPAGKTGMTVILVGRKKVLKFSDASDLLPFAFEADL